jgi:hypothetical protein
MDSETKQRSLASLSIYSRRLSVEELKQMVPFSPERSREKGTPRGGQAGNVHRHSVVVYESHMDREQSLNAHLEDLLTRIAPAKDALRAFAARARAEGFQSPSGLPSAPVILRLYSRNINGSIGLGVSNDQLKAIFNLGADLAVELETNETIDTKAQAI